MQNANGKCQILAFPEESLLGERKECRISNAEYRISNVVMRTTSPFGKLRAALRQAQGGALTSIVVELTQKS